MTHGRIFLEKVLIKDFCHHNVCIFETLFQADIKHSTSFEKSRVLNYVEDFNSSEASLKFKSVLVNMKDYFQTTTINDVDSLSRFLIKEFERIFISFLDVRDFLDKTLIVTMKDADPKVHFSGDDVMGNQCPVSLFGHASENEKRDLISSHEDLWDSDTNQDIC
ncbi:unnamed protein product [Cuscuta epithymum]|uniref:Uncharacterized protein n=1 Tax=Cuscuta epithymum TaxID=186058 RepID=A0AAV0E1A5_9ASTE|nr:unnamed protein product [Cuscuta epithymum]